MPQELHAHAATVNLEDAEGELQAVAAGKAAGKQKTKTGRKYEEGSIGDQE